jgi:hypothetical protein
MTESIIDTIKRERLEDLILSDYQKYKHKIKSLSLEQKIKINTSQFFKEYYGSMYLPQKEFKDIDDRIKVLYDECYNLPLKTYVDRSLSMVNCLFGDMVFEAGTLLFFICNDFYKEVNMITNGYKILIVSEYYPIYLDHNVKTDDGIALAYKFAHTNTRKYGPIIKK